MKFPTFSQWKQIFKVLTKKERNVFLVFFLLALFSCIFMIINFYINATTIVKNTGGSYSEGIVGQPRLINPLYGETNDIDRTLIELMFSSLVTHDNSGDIIEDLAKSYKISDDGRVYDFQLKDNIFWTDGKQLTADDIVYTIETIQNSDYKSPLRANWIDVEVDKTSSKSVRFVLKVPYNSFLENLTLKILPKHIWENISAENFTLSPYNLQPVGSGSYRFSTIRQEGGFIREMGLESNRRYYKQPSYISTISFKFFENKKDLLQAANQKEISGFTLAALDNNEAETEREVPQGWAVSNQFSVFSFTMPRYFALFFNTQKSSIFADANIRKGMTHAVNKDELMQTITTETKSNVSRVDSPILPDFFGFNQPTTIYDYNIDTANTLLDKTGFKYTRLNQREKPLDKKQAFQFRNYLKSGSLGNEVAQLQSCLAKLDEAFKTLLQSETTGKYGSDTENAVTKFQKKYLPDAKPTGETGIGTRQKLNELCFTQSPTTQPLKFTITTVDQPQLVHIANLLKNYFTQVGAIVDIKAVSIGELKPIIKERSYDALLYGEALGAEPDLYPFWHSSQKIDPGLNLSSYENKNVNKLLKEARETIDSSVKKQKYESLQDLIIADDPALFLFNPDYIYWVSSTVKGIDTEKIVDPAQRFSNVTNWYIKTKRTWR